MTIQKTYGLGLLLGASLLFSACASQPYRPIVDERPSQRLNYDISSCQGLADNYQKNQGYTANSVMSGALSGGVIGGFQNGLQGGLIGGALGGALGLASGGFNQADSTNYAHKNIVINCLRGRGHRVIG